jgi:hypothetical protein
MKSLRKWYMTVRPSVFPKLLDAEMVKVVEDDGGSSVGHDWPLGLSRGGYEHELSK